MSTDSTQKAAKGKLKPVMATIGILFGLGIGASLIFSELALPPAGEPGADAQMHQEWLVPVSVDEHAAGLGGFDPVTYFSESGPEKGDPELRMDWEGASWVFASQENLETFRRSPETYAPQFGGHCAFAASVGKRVQGNPEVWSVVGGRLFLNANSVARVLTRAVPGRLAAAYSNWPTVAGQPLE